MIRMLRFVYELPTSVSFRLQTLRWLIQLLRVGGLDPAWDTPDPRYLDEKGPRRVAFILYHQARFSRVVAILPTLRCSLSDVLPAEPS